MSGLIPDINGHAVLAQEQVADIFVYNFGGAMFGDFDGRKQPMVDPRFIDRHSTSHNRLNFKASSSNALYKGSELRVASLRVLAIIKT